MVLAVTGRGRVVVASLKEKNKNTLAILLLN